MSMNSDTFIPTLSVTCLEGFDGGLPQIFLLEAWQDGRVLANISSEFPEWVISGMEAGNWVTLNIVGHNVYGRSDPVTIKAQTNSAQHQAAPAKETEVEVPPIVGAVMGVMGVILVLFLVGVAILRRSYSCTRKSFAEKTVASSSGEGLDPDVVQSIKRLDVVSCVQEENAKEETDPMFTSPEQRYPHGKGETLHEMHQITVERKRGEGLLTCQMQADSFDSAQQHRSYHTDRQRLNLSQEQSDDSGVSESESDNELKLPEADGAPSPQCVSDLSYIALPLSRDVRSQDQESSARDSGTTYPSTLTGMTTKCSSTKELYGISEGGGPVSRRSYEWSPTDIPLRQMPFDLFSRDMIQTSPPEKSKRGPPTREEATQPVEVICLAVTPTGVLTPLTSESQVHAKEESMHLLPQSVSVGQSSDHPNNDPARNPSLNRSDIGVPVTLYKADNGELLLLPRNPTEYEGIGAQLSTAPVYTITTLPKATGKKSKGSLENRHKEKDYSKIEEGIRKLHTNLSKNRDIDTRDYVPPTHPDVSRRESSV